MVGVLVLGACTEVLHTERGDEVLRGAVWVEALYANVPEYTALVVANSPLPCAPDTDVDDPDTDVDEAASATTWWQAQLLSAFTREDAVVLWVWFPEGTAAADVALGPAEPGGYGFRWRVEEAALAGREGAISTWTPTEWDLGADDSGRATLRAEPDAVTAEVELGEWSGTWRAERCDEPALAATLQAAALTAILAPGS